MTERVAAPSFRYQVIGISSNGPVALTRTSWTAFLLRDALARNQPGEFTVCDMSGNAVERTAKDANSDDD